MAALVLLPLQHLAPRRLHPPVCSERVAPQLLDPRRLRQQPLVSSRSNRERHCLEAQVLLDSRLNQRQAACSVQLPVSLRKAVDCSVQRQSQPHQLSADLDRHRLRLRREVSLSVPQQLALHQRLVACLEHQARLVLVASLVSLPSSNLLPAVDCSVNQLASHLQLHRSVLVVPRLISPSLAAHQPPQRLLSVLQQHPLPPRRLNLLSALVHQPLAADFSASQPSNNNRHQVSINAC